MLTQEYLKECLHYDPSTGQFTWLKRPRSHFKNDQVHLAWNTRFAGKLAGNKKAEKKSRTSYLVIGIDGKTCYAHRLAWLYVHGKWPDNHIDHIDGNGLNNNLGNLRDVTQRQNQMNNKTSRNNTSGFNGVSWCKRCSKWLARIMVNGKNKHLGYYCTLEAAIAARDAANEKYGYTTLSSENALTKQDLKKSV